MLFALFINMNCSCPNSQCLNHHGGKHIIRDGSYYRPSDGRHIQRFRCKICGKRFSSSTFNLAYRQNKRRVNHKLRILLSSGVSMRRCARILNVHHITVARKLRYLAQKARQEQQKFLQNIGKNKVQCFQFDDLITIEHTKCKPLSVTLAVETYSRKILGVEVSRMPAFGHLAAVSRQKYGHRIDEREHGIDKLFKKISPYIHRHVTIISDEHNLYPPQVLKHFPKSTHIRHKGGRGCIAGQGELKKLHYDPLFDLNHTCAMLRANVNRLIRKTWCSSKSPERLDDHLAIYLNYHNHQLT